MMTDEQSELDVDTLKEVVRQNELMLSAQLQARLALEGKSTSVTSWISTLLIATLGALYALKGNAGAKDIINLLLVIAIGLLLAGFASLSSMITSGKWTYVGNTPSFFISYINVKEPTYWSSWLLNYIRKIGKRRRPLFEVKVSSDFKFKNNSIEQVLQKTIIYYAEGISRNEDILRSIKNVSNIPAPIIFVALFLAIALTPTPKPAVESSVHQTSPVNKP